MFCWWFFFFCSFLSRLVSFCYLALARWTMYNVIYAVRTMHELSDWPSGWHGLTERYERAPFMHSAGWHALTHFLPFAPPPSPLHCCHTRIYSFVQFTLIKIDAGDSAEKNTGSRTGFKAFRNLHGRFDAHHFMFHTKRNMLVCTIHHAVLVVCAQKRCYRAWNVISSCSTGQQSNFWYASILPARVTSTQKNNVNFLGEPVAMPDWIDTNLSVILINYSYSQFDFRLIAVCTLSSQPNFVLPLLAMQSISPFMLFLNKHIDPICDSIHIFRLYDTFFMCIIYIPYWSQWCRHFHTPIQRMAYGMAYV